MRRLLVTAFAAVLFAGSSSAASFVSSFNKSVNDGVFTLTGAEAAALGTPDADRLGFFRVRAASGQTWSVGDVFEAQSVIDSFVAGDRSKVLGVFNGLTAGNADLTYAGGDFAPLGTTTFDVASASQSSFFRAVAITFKAAGGNINFNGGNFSAANKGAFGDAFGPLTAVPLPAAAWLLISGVAGLGLLGRRRAA